MISLRIFALAFSFVVLCAVPVQAEMTPLSFRSLDYKTDFSSVNTNTTTSGDDSGVSVANSQQACNVVIGSVLSDQVIRGDVQINVSIRGGVSVRCGRF